VWERLRCGFSTMDWARRTRAQTALNGCSVTRTTGRLKTFDAAVAGSERESDGRTITTTWREEHKRTSSELPESGRLTLSYGYEALDGSHITASDSTTARSDIRLRRPQSFTESSQCNGTSMKTIYR